MSKKKTEKEEVEVEVEKKVSSKKNKKEKKKDETEVKDDNLKTLIELVNESSIPRQLMIILLDEHDYLNQFYEEERKFEKQEIIKPSISLIEFNKIIGG